MRQITTVVALFASAVCQADSTDSKTAALQGVWFGTGDAQRIVLAIRDDKMIFIHPMGPAESSYRLKEDGQIEGADDRIEIDRFDGKKQVGVYRCEESTLTMTLANPGETMRPATVRVFKSGRAGRGTTIFTRRITPEGLQTLQVILKNNPELDLMGIEAISKSSD